MIRISLAALLIAMATGSALAQAPGGRTDALAKRSFYLDYAAFRDSQSSDISLEIYYKIFSTGLAFQKWGDKYKANYTVDITVSHKKKQITGVSKDGNLVADTYKQTRAVDDFIINRVVFKIPADDYEMAARLSDPTSGELSRLKTEDVKLNEFMKRSPSLSSLEFVRETRPSENDSQFVRSNMVLIPSVSRVFGDEDPDLIVYYEIYNEPEFKGDYNVVYDLHAGDKKALSDTVQFPGTGATTIRVERFHVDNFQPGEYAVDLNVQSADKKFQLRTSADFVIGWSVLAIVKNDWKTALAQLRYVASPDEIKKLSGADTKDHIKSWEDFWKKKDPTPSTEENELKDEYYKRIRYSDLNFGNFGRDGWKTDMGMVYVIYGPPDEIEQHPFDIDAKPYQIWYYYTTKKVFTFVDINGYGDYELAYPYDGDIRGIH